MSPSLPYTVTFTVGQNIIDIRNNLLRKLSCLDLDNKYVCFRGIALLEFMRRAKNEGLCLGITDNGHLMEAVQLGKLIERVNNARFPFHGFTITGDGRLGMLLDLISSSFDLDSPQQVIEIGIVLLDQAYRAHEQGFSFDICNPTNRKSTQRIIFPWAPQ